MPQPVELLHMLPCLLREAQWRVFEWQLETENRNARTPLNADDVRAHRIAKLRMLLIRTPYWSAGHYKLAAQSLAANDIASAYASAQAVLTLQPQGAVARRAKALLARCYLKRGGTKEARALVEELLALDPAWWEVREDLAAIFVIEGAFADAVREFEKIPAAKRSTEAQAAFSFAQQKIAGA